MGFVIYPRNSEIYPRIFEFFSVYKIQNFILFKVQKFIKIISYKKLKLFFDWHTFKLASYWA